MGHFLELLRKWLGFTQCAMAHPCRRHACPGSGSEWPLDLDGGLRHGGGVVVVAPLVMSGSAPEITRSADRCAWVNCFRGIALEPTKVRIVRVVLVPADEPPRFQADASVVIAPPRLGIAIAPSVADHTGHRDLASETFALSLSVRVRARMSRFLSVAAITSPGRKSRSMAGCGVEGH